MVDLMVAHIVAVLPSTLMRKFLRGDWKKSLLAIMKLTLPYFARTHAPNH